MLNIFYFLKFMDFVILRKIDYELGRIQTKKYGWIGWLEFVIFANKNKCYNTSNDSEHSNNVI